MHSTVHDPKGVFMSDKKTAVTENDALISAFHELSLIGEQILLPESMTEDTLKRNVRHDPNEITSYLKNCPFTVIHERGEAITEALERFGDSAVIVAAGKGDENAQKKNRVSVPYLTDKYYVNAWLEKYNKEHRPVTEVNV